MSITMSQEYLSPAKVAVELDKSVGTVFRYARENKLTPYRIDGGTKFASSEVEKLKHELFTPKRIEAVAQCG